VTSHPIFAFFCRWAGWLGDRAGFAARRRRLLADAEGAVVEIGAGTGLSFRPYPAGLQVLATEPDPHMLKAARKADVLCSVPDQAAALAEAERVLRPGGMLLLEHVRAADPALARKPASPKER
jgi:hypothetical protein